MVAFLYLAVCKNLDDVKIKNKKALFYFLWLQIHDDGNDINVHLQNSDEGGKEEGAKHFQLLLILILLVIAPPFLSKKEIYFYKVWGHLVLKFHFFLKQKSIGVKFFAAWD